MQEFLKPAGRPGVDYAVRGEPAPLGGCDPVAEVCQVPGGVGVGVDGEDGSVPQGQPDEVGGEVQAVGEGVDLQRGAGAGAGREYGVPVGVDGRALADATPVPIVLSAGTSARAIVSDANCAVPRGRQDLAMRGRILALLPLPGSCSAGERRQGDADLEVPGRGSAPGGESALSP